jgi:NhaA family Na+:H+ antiporter
LIGLEVKRELIYGELSKRNRLVLPAAAAFGGAAFPAAIYMIFHFNGPGQSGWAIPMATDIAFVVGLLTLLGSRVPHGLKIFLLSLAIVDDIIAVIVIAVYYSSLIKFDALIAAVIGMGLIAFLSRIGVRAVFVYVFIGGIIWLFTLKSGVHPTLAGVLLGLMTPAGAWVRKQAVAQMLGKAKKHLDTDEKKTPPPETEPQQILETVSSAAKGAISPLERLEPRIHPWVYFVIMPLFALANAGVTLSPSSFQHPVSFAVVFSLFLGKPAGIVLVSWITVRLGWTRLPDGVSWMSMFGAGLLAGIGFTMAIFVASLAMTGEMLDIAKSGIIIGSVISAVLGLILLRLSLRKQSVQI